VAPRPGDNRKGVRPRLAAPAASRALERVRRVAPTLLCGLAVLVAVSLLSAGAPSTAAAAQGGLIDHFPDPLDAFDAASDAVKGGAVSAFGAILGALFGGIQANITTALITWLVAIPNFNGGNIQQLAGTLDAIAFGLLGVVMTFAVVRYWLSGLSSSGAGGAEAVDGFTRTIGAALFILAWPLLFMQGVALSNAATAAVMHSGTLTDDLTHLFRAAVIADFTLGQVGWIINVILALAGTLLLLALVLMKIVLSAATAVLFVAMPIAVILWPISELSWVARTAARGLFVCLLVPLVWVVLFATAAAISVDALSFKGGGGVLDSAIIKPVTAIALLYLAVTAPKALMKAAMLGASGPGGGFVSRTASYMAGRQASAALDRHIPAALGGAKAPAPDGPGSSGRGAPASRSRAAAATPGGSDAQTAATISATAALGAGAAAAAGSAAARKTASVSGASTAAAPADIAQGAAARAAQKGDATTAADGPAGPGDARRPYNQQAHSDELTRARQRASANPPTAADVSSAIGALTPEQRQAATKIAGDPGASGDKPMRGYAYLAAHEPATQAQREAFRTLAAASPAARDQGLAHGPTVSMKTTPAAERTPDAGGAAGRVAPGTSGVPHSVPGGPDQGPGAPDDSAGLGSAGGAGAFGGTGPPSPAPPHHPAPSEPPDADSPATPPRPGDDDESPFAAY
jgi:hypothetical protein